MKWLLRDNPKKTYTDKQKIKSKISNKIKNRIRKNEENLIIIYLKTKGVIKND